MDTFKDTEHRTHKEAVAGFDLGKLAGEFGGDPDNGLNACVECCGRHTGMGKQRCASCLATARFKTFPSTNTLYCLPDVLWPGVHR